MITAMTTATTENEVSAAGTMSIGGHIDELRKRLFVFLIAMVIGTGIGFAFGEKLISLLARPIGGLQNLISIEVTENIAVFMRVSILAGFIIALPVLVYEILAFITPALEKRERPALYLAIPFAVFLFVAGVSFAYFVMLPAALPFLISFLGVPTTPRLANYFKFVTNLMFWLGLSFELPLVSFILAKLGVITAGGLARQWRVAIVVIAVVAAVITPTPDPVNMAIVMVPLFVLFWLSVLLASMARGKKRKEEPV